MQGNAFTDWLQNHAKATVPLAHQNNLQLRAATALKTLQPVEHQAVHNMSPHPYLPQPNRYLGPVNHSRIQTHQQPTQQSPLTLNPGIPSAYLLAPKKNGL